MYPSHTTSCDSAGHSCENSGAKTKTLQSFISLLLQYVHHYIYIPWTEVAFFFLIHYLDVGGMCAHIHQQYSRYQKQEQKEVRP